MKKLIIFLVVLVSAVWTGSAADAAIIVGRISHVEGEINRYMDVDDSWVETHLQSPAGIEDDLATGHNSKAEITFPNNLLLRLDGNTELEIQELDDDLGVFQLHSGLARLYNRSVSGRLAIETVRGTVKVAPGSVIDVRVDGNTVEVSAVRGEATFQSFRNGVERLEVISGSTSLEFHEESIVAGTGPISWNWDRWCANREGVWAQNRLVRSEYLPDSMQEYAYEMEPYGSWSRVYYRGYYYWAWKPHYLAVGWSPFTSGYWSDWHGSPVWIDHNPWGWATHHHGHWLRMHGSWMWTPYVHVSHIPGVTVIGSNITFGKKYRPYWHPGRVRWITHNDSIGWFPLAPWETYYGSHRWGPGTVLVQGGSSFSLSINLSNHRYIDHAVIIPKHHLHKKGPVVVNYYNTVKIRNINKTAIVKNYKSMQTAERERARKNTAAKSVRARKTERRSALVQPERKEVKARENTRHERLEKREARVIQTQRAAQEERSAKSAWQRDSRQAIAKEHSAAIERGRENTGARERQKRVVRPEQRTSEQNSEKQKKPLQRSSITASVSSEKTRVIREKRDQAKTREIGQTEVETSSSKVVQEKPIERRKRDREAGEQREPIQEETHQYQRKIANGDRAIKENLNKNRQNRGRDFVSASVNKRRFR